MSISARIRMAALGPTPQWRNALLMDWLPSCSPAMRGRIRHFVTYQFHSLSVTNQRTLLLFVALALESEPI